MNDLKIFSGSANPSLAKRITDYLGVPLGEIALGRFPDGEISCKVNEDVRGRDVFLIQPTCPPVNENIMQLLVMIDSCLRASAERITAVIPYFGYARQDRKDEGRVPITAKLVANLITRAGANRVQCRRKDLQRPKRMLTVDERRRNRRVQRRVGDFLRTDDGPRLCYAPLHLDLYHLRLYTAAHPVSCGCNSRDPLCAKGQPVSALAATGE